MSTCLRHLARPAFAPTSAHSARIALWTNFTMSAQTAAAALRQGQSGRQRNGDQAFRLPSDRPRTNVSAFPLSQPKSQRSRKDQEHRAHGPLNPICPQALRNSVADCPNVSLFNTRRRQGQSPALPQRILIVEELRGVTPTYTGYVAFSVARYRAESSRRWNSERTKSD